MKISTLVLALSLAANVALVAVFVAGGNSAHPTATVERASVARAAPAKAAVNAETWSALQNEDRRAEIAKLQAEGFPPAVIRAIVLAQVMESFAARRKALEGASDTAFWLPPSRDPNAQAALRALYREQGKLLKDLLGPDPDNSTAAQLRRQAPELPADKIDQLAQIRERYDEQRQDVYANFRGGSLLPEEREKIAALDKAMHTEFAGVLTPEELETYDLRTSNTANNLRYNLAAFDATEQEFRALYKLQSAFDDQYNGLVMAGMSDEQRRARMDAQKTLDQNIKLALGDERYADYQRATDYSYRTTTQLVARLELPPETTNQVYAVQKDIQQRVTALRTDRSMSMDDRNAQIAALATEAQTKLTAALTPRGYEAYKQYGGNWLQMLQPRPMPQAGAVSTGTLILSPGR